MKGKMHGNRGSMAADDIRAEILNPFVHNVELDTTFDKIKTAIFTVVLLPFRVMVICYLLVTAWFLACLGLYGLSEEDLRSRPMTGWRRSLSGPVSAMIRAIYTAGGFYGVRVCGAPLAQPSEAPVLCVAPHSSFFDAVVLGYTGAPSVVAKAETARLPLFGTMRPVLCTIGKWSYLAGGMAITIKGKQASRHDAPILVVAPHSTFLDSCIVYATRMSSVIVRRESMDNYVGKLINYTQPVYVWRDDPNSRQNTIKEIIERATSPDWPQILIFPEGTCTNRSCLITFKPGGFYPGVPVQPVTIRYPNHLDTVTWTWEGPSALKLLWLTLTRVHTACEIEFLPVYHPSEAEKKDPKLYASNVRNVMAKALGIPVSDYTYDDCRLLCRAKQLNIPHATSLVEAQKNRHILGLDASRKECSLIDRGGKDAGTLGNAARVNFKQFCERLEISETDSTSHALFSVFADKKTNEVDWQEYLMSAAFLSLPGAQTSEILRYAFKVYDDSGVGRLSHEAVIIALSRCAALAHEEGSAAFQQVDMDARGWISSEEFFNFARKKVEFAFLFHSEDAISKVKTS